MGMAASQARFLNLTARKSNTEYQGQQVNQARSVLALESANIVAQMAALEVPTPPIKTDYSQMAYSFVDANGVRATITGWQTNTDPNVKATHTVSVTRSIQLGSSNIYQDDSRDNIPVTMSQNGSGRFLEIEFAQNDPGLGALGMAGGKYGLAVTKVTDDEGYDSAWNQYLYDKNEYDKKVEELNAETARIQADDKTLELQLKQLDTEQEALTQEMEAVKAVIQKNVEKTFNTFA